ncbi:MAG TPA: ATP-dependent DNA ligase [Candidatus Binataceae bacterium]|nr:ATP-dependent DNA ligase [Candidatus Binataceae bacterium]
MASLYNFALICQALSQTQSRLQIAEAVATFLASLDPAEAAISARFLIGRATEQGDEKRLQISGRAVWKIVAEIAGAEDQGEEIFATAEDFGDAIEIALKNRSPDPTPSLTITELDAKFREIAEIEGRHARGRKLEALRELFIRASAMEAKYIAKILIGEMRHGMSEGVLIEAIAKMASRPVAEVRRLHMLESDVGRVVATLRSSGADKAIASALSGVAPVAAERAPKPLKPMLAQPAGDVAEAFAVLGPDLALEHKLDGARVQVHCAVGESVRIFSRRLNEITPSLPEVVEQMRALSGRRAIIDGEVIAIDSAGRPQAFQELMRRFGRTREVDDARVEQPIRLYAFDLLALDGKLLIDRPYAERIEALDSLTTTAEIATVGRVVRPRLPEAEKFYSEAVAAGFEGVMAKSIASKYTPGVRGRGWLKIKYSRTLDLVIVAAEWGYGRRKGWLSNYHLAARGERADEFVTIGKTFKGFTDDQFREMTERLLALKIAEEHGVVTVRPAVVAEVAFNGIQRSPSYESGMALRFARIVRIRDDRTAEGADTIATVTREYERQALKPLAEKL